MWVLGISGSHNSAAALVRDGRVVVAVQTERLTRIKRHPITLSAMSYESAAVIEYCLRAAGIDLPDVDIIATCSPSETRAAFSWRDAPPPRALPPFVSVPHHLAHAEYVVHYAASDQALVLVSDGSGTFEDTRSELDIAEHRAEPVEHISADGKESISAYVFDGAELRLVHRIAHGPARRQPPGAVFRTPYGTVLISLGHVWQWAAHYCHGSINEAGKVMGLAPYGDPEVHADLHTVRMSRDGDLLIDFDGLFDRFQQPNVEGRDITGETHYADLAAHVQAETNAFMVELVSYLRNRFPLDLVHYTGGVALNSITNEHLVRRLGVELAMNGSCEDNGTAIGAALAVHHARTGARVAEPVTDYYGREYEPVAIEAALATAGLPAVPRPWGEVVSETARALASGAIVGWFQGRSEFGPRALGNRSILADPRRADMRDVLNSRVKHREAFRPFAPVVLAEHATEWFDLDGESPLMLRVVGVRSDRIPAVTHVDGSARVQTITRDQNDRLYDLVTAFAGETGVPVLLNTSFNVAGEPIVETPEDAVRTFLGSGLNLLVLGNFIVRRD